MDKAALIPELLQLFRQEGYEGVTISTVSKATGLGKSSLYHYFPQGKEQMAKEVLEHIDAAVQEYFVGPLMGKGSPEEKLKLMSKNIEQFYEGGRKGCLVEGLTLGATSAPFQKMIATSLESWLDAMAQVATASGVSKKLARHRAEGALVAIEGSLITSRALNNYEIFNREIKNLPRLILKGLTPGG